MAPEKKTGMLVIISAPSGGGKNAVVTELIKKIPGAARFVTTTTRPMRPGEAEGVDYWYVTREEFAQKKEQGDFVEYNQYADEWYGTDRRRLDEALASHPVIFATIDVNGRQHFLELGIPHCAIFLLPESMETLKDRIRRRGGVEEDKLQERIAEAERECREAPRYDHQLVNYEGKLDETATAVLDILVREGGVDKKSVL
jgi:guanylate kinase